MMDLWQFLQSIGIASTITAGAVWLIQKIITEFFKRKETSFEQNIERQQREFQYTLDQKLEAHKTELQKSEYQFQKLQEQRLRIISELYSKIAKLDREMARAISLLKIIPTGKTADEVDKEDFDKINELFQDFYNHYICNKIFFEKDVCDSLDKLSKIYWESFWKATERIRFGTTDIKENYKNAKEAVEILKTQIPEIKESIEDMFRKKIGIE